jgi:hypothetical protein
MNEGGYGQKGGCVFISSSLLERFSAPPRLPETIQRTISFLLVSEGRLEEE